MPVTLSRCNHYLMGSNYREGFVSCTDACSICATKHWLVAKKMRIERKY